MKSPSQQTHKKERHPDEITFPEAMKAVIDGSTVTKIEWSKPEMRVKLHEGFLMIYNVEGDDKWHPLQISDGDMLFGQDDRLTNSINKIKASPKGKLVAARALHLARRLSYEQLCHFLLTPHGQANYVEIRKEMLFINACLHNRVLPSKVISDNKSNQYIKQLLKKLK